MSAEGFNKQPASLADIFSGLKAANENQQPSIETKTKNRQILLGAIQELLNNGMEFSIAFDTAFASDAWKEELPAEEYDKYAIVVHEMFGRQYPSSRADEASRQAA